MDQARVLREGGADVVEARAAPGGVAQGEGLEVHGAEGGLALGEVAGGPGDRLSRPGLGVPGRQRGPGEVGLVRGAPERGKVEAVAGGFGAPGGAQGGEVDVVVLARAGVEGGALAVGGVTRTAAALDFGEDLAPALGEGLEHVLGDAGDAHEAAGVGVDLVAQRLELAPELGLVDGGPETLGGEEAARFERPPLPPPGLGGVEEYAERGVMV